MALKEYKLKKDLLNKHPVALLKAYGLVNDKHKACYPERCFVSKQDLDIIRNTIKKLACAEYKGYTSKYIETVVAYEWLQYSPNERFKNAIRPGYVLIDEMSEEE